MHFIVSYENNHPVLQILPADALDPYDQYKRPLYEDKLLITVSGRNLIRHDFKQDVEIRFFHLNVHPQARYFNPTIKVKIDAEGKAAIEGFAKSQSGNVTMDATMFLILMGIRKKEEETETSFKERIIRTGKMFLKILDEAERQYIKGRTIKYEPKIFETIQKTPSSKRKDIFPFLPNGMFKEAVMSEESLKEKQEA
jgi:hypothetical protein